MDSDGAVTLGRTDFLKAWRDQGEDTHNKAQEVAWRRYQQVQGADSQAILEASGPTLKQLEAGLSSFIQNPAVAPLISSHKFISIPSNTIPWKPTGLAIKTGGLVSTFATGRLWRSKILDLFLAPQFGLYFRVGVNGTVFNSTRDTNTFQVNSGGELYLAPQFPGQFANPQGGRVQGALKAYELANFKGSYQVLVIVWNDSVTHEKVAQVLNACSDTTLNEKWYGLITQEIDRLAADPLTLRFPSGWQNLWFLGTNEIYTQTEFDGHKGIRCCPNQNAGILHKNFEPAIPFTKNFTVSWDWCITALPSRLREDTAISHDYLSVAFEFENGRDLTYTWSWELPTEYGYWCPLPTWEDREYHVVIRTGTEGLGTWIEEKRDLYADYRRFIGMVNLPTQVVRVWLIAGNRWQRHKGEMLVRKVVMGDVSVL